MALDACSSSIRSTETVPEAACRATRHEYRLVAPRLPPGHLTPEGRSSMAAENRLSADQLAALVPGDTVVIETSGDFRRPKLTTGIVVRIEGSHLVVSTRSPRGVCYVTQFGRRDGVSVGGGRRSELVNGEA